jgi:hypothetical protein
MLAPHPPFNPLSPTPPGLAAFWTSIAVALGAHFAGYFALENLYDMYLQLMTASIVFSFAISIFCYIKARMPGAMLAEGGNSGGSTLSAPPPPSHPAHLPPFSPSSRHG